MKYFHTSKANNLSDDIIKPECDKLTSNIWPMRLNVNINRTDR